jgi:hypothetical protein
VHAAVLHRSANSSTSCTMLCLTLLRTPPEKYSTVLYSTVLYSQLSLPHTPVVYLLLRYIPAMTSDGISFLSLADKPIGSFGPQQSIHFARRFSNFSSFTTNQLYKQDSSIDIDKDNDDIIHLTEKQEFSQTNARRDSQLPKKQNQV